MTLLSMVLILIGLVAFLMTIIGTVELLMLTVGSILPRKKQFIPPQTPKRPLPKTALVIPAHNESQGIEKTVQNVKLCQGIYTIIVIADNCDDDTASISKAQEVRVIERNSTTHIGKSHALHFAFTQLTSEGFDLFIVIDADSQVETNFVHEVQQMYVSGIDAMQMGNVIHKKNTIKSRLLFIAFTAFNRERPLGRQNLSFSAGIFGNGFALTKTVLEKVPYQTGSLVEDIAYHLQLVEADQKVYFNDQTFVSSYIATKGKQFVQQRARWEGGRLKLIKQYSPYLISKIFQGQFQLVEPLMDLLLLPLAYHAFLLFILIFIPYFRVYALLSLSIIFLHLIRAIVIGKGDIKDFGALIFSPIYMFWKLIQLLNIGKIINRGVIWNRNQK